ncbi:MAG: hypothetical protein LBC31_11165 [Treponema sp.]|nr:hypothetical protein [Treponema sp.]
MLLVLAALPAAARDPGGEEFFAAAGAEASLFTDRGAAGGGGLSLGCGYGEGALGFRAFCFTGGGITTVELALFLRAYPFRENRGFFVQAETGAGLFAMNGGLTVPAETGRITAGLAAGWRFLLGGRWYLEPSLRAGFPYIAGGGVSAGFRL